MKIQLSEEATISAEHVYPDDGDEVLLIKVDTPYDETHFYVNRQDTYALGMYFKRLGALLTDTRWVD